jgi:3-hydroxybutyryl-CoA dehydrogenase
MTILIRGTQDNYQEFKLKFPTFSQVSLVDEEMFNASELSNEVIFDFQLDVVPGRITDYEKKSELRVFGSSVKRSLASICAGRDVSCSLFGFNGLPTFLNRELLEVSVRKDEDTGLLKKTCAELDTDYELIADRVGMVTPRIVFMIINEAYYTVQEGTATKEDIDMGMKLGTNYPHGPFEWKALVGIDHVYEVLEAIYQDTHEERYKICPMLKTEYLNAL